MKTTTANTAFLMSPNPVQNIHQATQAVPATVPVQADLPIVEVPAAALLEAVPLQEETLAVLPVIPHQAAVPLAVADQALAAVPLQEETQVEVLHLEESPVEAQLTCSCLYSLSSNFNF
jgi:hypothetical protein